MDYKINFNRPASIRIDARQPALVRADAASERLRAQLARLRAGPRNLAATGRRRGESGANPIRMFIDML